MMFFLNSDDSQLLKICTILRIVTCHIRIADGKTVELVIEIGELQLLLWYHRNPKSIKKIHCTFIYRTSAVITTLIVIYEPSARRHFSRMSALFEARATKERVLHLRECAEYVFVHRSSYNIFLNEHYRVPFVNRWRLSMRLRKCQSN
jgi:hypothetical protein